MLFTLEFNCNIKRRRRHLQMSASMQSTFWNCFYMAYSLFGDHVYFHELTAREINIVRNWFHLVFSFHPDDDLIVRGEDAVPVYSLVAAGDFSLRGHDDAGDDPVDPAVGDPSLHDPDDVELERPFQVVLKVITLITSIFTSQFD